MRSIVSLVVAVAVTLHSLLGCCWHHAHGAEATVDQHGSAACPATHCRCGHDDADDHERGHADEHGASELRAKEFPASEPAPRELAAGECPVSGSDETAASESAEHEHPEPCPGSCSGKVFVVTTARVQFEHSPATVLAAIAATRLEGSAEIRSPLAEYGLRDAATYPPPTRLHLLHRSLLI